MTQLKMFIILVGTLLVITACSIYNILFLKYLFFFVAGIITVTLIGWCLWYVAWDLSGAWNKRFSK